MAIVVRNNEVIENKGYGVTINQISSLYLDPVVKEKQLQNINAAIIEIFDDKRPVKIHLNKEVEIKVEFKNPINSSFINKEISIDLKDVNEIIWSESKLDGNSGKILLLRWNPDLWILHFDFRYNQYSENKLSIANDFIRAAKKLDPKEDENVLIYILWSAVELIVDCQLGYSSGGKTHKRVHTDRIQRAQILRDDPFINFQSIYEILLTLSSNKDAARYGDKKVNHEKINEGYLLQAVSKLEEISHSIAKI